MDPPYIKFVDPYGGTGLKTRTAEAARRRIDGLLAACAAGPAHEQLELEVREPAATAFVRRIREVTAWRGPCDALVRDHAHQLGPIATEAWAAFGTPSSARGCELQTPGSREYTYHVEWHWEREALAAAADYDAFGAYLIRHQAEQIGEWTPCVVVHSTWRFRLRSAAGSIPDPAYPESRIIANLRQRHASAFFLLVFPYATVGSAFLDDYHAVCAALGMKLAPAKFRLDATTPHGKRRRTKLPAFV